MSPGCRSDRGNHGIGESNGDGMNRRESRITRAVPESNPPERPRLLPGSPMRQKIIPCVSMNPA